MKKFFVCIIALLSIAVSANASSYKLNDSDIDALIENAVEVSPLTLMTEAPAVSPVAASLPALKAANPSPVASFLLCFFLGGFGVHRHYMGTKPGMWAIYTFTFGGIFGIVPLIDWIMLIVGLVDDDISKYCNNTAFFMWA